MDARALAEEILLNAHLMAAMAAENGFCCKVFRFPALSWVISKCLMTLVARIVFTTAFELDGNDIKRACIVRASRVFIELKAIYFLVIH